MWQCGIFLSEPGQYALVQADGKTISIRYIPGSEELTQCIKEEFEIIAGKNLPPEIRGA